MPRTRLPDSPELCRQKVDLAGAGRDLDDLAREFEPFVQSIYTWVTKVAAKEGRGEGASPGLSFVERDELSRLRLENR